MSREPKSYTKEQQERAATSARNATQPTQRASRRANRGASDAADYSSVDPAILHSAIVAIAKRGCAIQFGYTRDGGAYSIRIVGDGDPYNEYVRPTEDMEAYLTGLRLDFEDGVGNHAV